MEILAGLLMGIVSYWISLQLTEPLTDFQATRGNAGAHFFFSFAVPKQFQPEMRFTVALTALVVVGWVHHVTQADWSAKLMFPLDSLNLPRGTAALQKHVRTNIMLQESVCIFKAWMNYTQKKHMPDLIRRKVLPQSTVPCGNTQYYITAQQCLIDVLLD